NIYQRTGVRGNRIPRPKVAVVQDTLKRLEEKATPFKTDLLASYNVEQRSAILKIASANIESTKFSISGSQVEMREKLKNINNHLLALNDKFVIAYACLLMFFIGAPLGAIIRKGGLGLP